MAMRRARFKLSLFLIPILVGCIITVHSDFPEETKFPFQDQDEFGSEHQFEGKLQSGGRIITPPASSPVYSSMPWGQIPGHQQFRSVRLIPFPFFGGFRVADNPASSASAAANQHTRNKKKKDCGFPILARRLIGPTLKRSQANANLPYFANSEEEIQEKSKEEDDLHSKVKKDSSITESHSRGCMAQRQWIDMGTDYYPRYVKSYHCSSTTCDMGMGECKPKHYTTKVLKRITPADTTSVEDCDLTLPEPLRFDWKLISVVVTTCCDCVSPGRMLGLK